MLKRHFYIFESGFIAVFFSSDAAMATFLVINVAKNGKLQKLGYFAGYSLILLKFSAET